MLNDGDWKGQAAYVLGGGPSLRGLSQSVVDFISRGLSICVNFAYEILPTSACVITEDVRFIQLASRKESWQKFKGEKILSCLEPSYEPLARAADPTVRIVPRKSSTRFWSKSIADGFSYSSNSMVPALNLADILGADPIYILGLDCKPVEPDKPTNFHTYYSKAPGFERTNNSQYEDFRIDFEKWVAPNLRHRRVVNLNPESGVTCWERVTPESVLGKQNADSSGVVLHTKLCKGSQTP